MAIASLASVSAAPYAPFSPGVYGASSSIVSVGLGEKTFVTEQVMGLLPGARARITESGLTAWLEGVVAFYDSTTNTLVLDADLTFGGGTFDDWTINIAGEPGGGSGGGAVLTATPPLVIVDHNIAIDLGNIAPLASPVFTGNPRAPTPTPGDNDTSVATTAFVTNAVVASGGGNVLSSGTPVSGQIARWISAVAIEGVTAASLGLATLASPVFTGNPQAPTPTVGDNDTSIATTAFVTAAVAAGGGSGDVVGPASANDNRIARFDGVTGKLIQNSGVVLDDGNNITIPGTLALSGGVIGATPSPQITMGSYYATGGASISHINLGFGAYGFGITSNTLNYFANGVHDFYTAASMVTPMLRLYAAGTASTSTTTGAVQVNGGVGVNGAIYANSMNAGGVSLSGSTSGAVTLKTAAAAGTWDMTLPTTAGTTGYFLQTDGAGVTTWAAAPGAGPGSGDVVGPASATDNRVARFDGATGKLIQSSDIIVSDTGLNPSLAMSMQGFGGAGYTVKGLVGAASTWDTGNGGLNGATLVIDAIINPGAGTVGAPGAIFAGTRITDDVSGTNPLDPYGICANIWNDVTVATPHGCALWGIVRGPKASGSDVDAIRATSECSDEAGVPVAQHPRCGLLVFNSDALNAFEHGVWVYSAKDYGFRVGGTPSIPAQVIPAIAFSSPGFQVTGTGILTSNGLVIATFSGLYTGIFPFGSPGPTNYGIVADTSGSDANLYINRPTGGAILFRENGTSVNQVAINAGGGLSLYGSTSGAVTLTTAAGAGTWTLTLPTTGGTSGYFLQTNGAGVATWAAAPGAGAGSGDVVGPASAVDNRVARFDGVTGKLIQDSSVYIDDSSRVSINTATPYVGTAGQAAQLTLTGPLYAAMTDPQLVVPFPTFDVSIPSYLGANSIHVTWTSASTAGVGFALAVQSSVTTAVPGALGAASGAIYGGMLIDNNSVVDVSGVVGTLRNTASVTNATGTAVLGIMRGTQGQGVASSYCLRAVGETDGTDHPYAGVFVHNTTATNAFTNGIIVASAEAYGVRVGLKSVEGAGSPGVVMPTHPYSYFSSTGSEAFYVTNTGTIVSLGGANIAAPLTLSGGVTGPSPTSQLVFADYYDNTAPASASHINLGFSGGYGFGISAGTLNYISSNQHDFYSAGVSLTNFAVRITSVGTASTSTTTGTLLVNGGVGVSGAIYANSMNAGGVSLSGSTSGAVTLKTAAAAGIWDMTLPTTGGTNGYFLRTDGAGVTTWAAAPGAGAGSGDVVGPASATDNAIARYDLATGKLLQNSSATLSDAGTLTITPTAASSTSGLIVNQSGAGVVAGDHAYNSINVIGESLDTGGIGNFVGGLVIRHTWGGATARGIRGALLVNTTQHAAAHVDNQSGGVSSPAATIAAFCFTADGGTNTGTGSRGGAIALNLVAEATGTNLAGCVGMEINCGISGGGSARYRWAMAAVGYRSIKPAELDTAISIGSFETATWTNAITLGRHHGSAPITGSVIAAHVTAEHATFAITNGIDLSAISISGYFLRGPSDNFVVTGAGQMIINGANANQILGTNSAPLIIKPTGVACLPQLDSTIATQVGLDIRDQGITKWYLVKSITNSLVFFDNAIAASAGTVMHSATNTGVMTFGLTGTLAGKIDVSGVTSGLISLRPQAAAGTYNWNWPTTAGSAGQVLTSGGGGAASMTWETPGGGSGDVVGPASATDNRVARFDGATGKLIQNSTATLSDAGTLTLAPTALSMSPGFVISQSGPTSGTNSSVFSFNSITTTDAIQQTNDNQAVNALQVVMSVGGANSRGLRQAFESTVYLVSPTDTGGGVRQRDYVGGALFAQAVTGDGGTNLTSDAKGAMFAANFAAVASSGATNLAGVIGAEVFARIDAGASAKYRFGFTIVAAGASQAGALAASPGAGVVSQDAMITCASTSLAQSWGNALLLTSLHGAFGIATNGSVIGTESALTDGSVATITNGINLAAVTISGSAFRTSNMILTGSGKLHLGANTVPTRRLEVLVASGDGIRVTDGTAQGDIGVGATFGFGTQTAHALNFFTSGLTRAYILAASSTLLLGGNGLAGAPVGTATVMLGGVTSGAVSVKVQDAAGTWDLTLPTTAGTAGYFLQTNGAGVTTWAAAGSGGSGDVVGSASATDNALARFDGTTGKLIQNSNVIVSDIGNITVSLASGTVLATGATTFAGGIDMSGSTITGNFLRGPLGPGGFDSFKVSGYGNIDSFTASTALGASYAVPGYSFNDIAGYFLPDFDPLSQFHIAFAIQGHSQVSRTGGFTGLQVNQYAEGRTNTAYVTGALLQSLTKPGATADSGRYFGVNPQVVIGTGLTVTEATVIEADHIVNSTVAVKACIRAADNSTAGGSVLDTAFHAVKFIGKRGYDNLIYAGQDATGAADWDSIFPIRTGGTLFYARNNSIVLANGIDLSACGGGFSGSAFKSPGFSVSGAGIVSLSGGVIGPTPTPRLVFNDYYDNTANVSVSHINLGYGAFGWGISSGTLNHFSSIVHDFYSVSTSLANYAMRISAPGTPSTSTTTGTLLVNGGVGVSGAIYANGLSCAGTVAITGATTITATSVYPLVITGTGATSTPMLDCIAGSQSLWAYADGGVIQWYAGKDAPGDFIFYHMSAGYQMRISKSATATHTSLMLYDTDNNAVERVSVGAADSGGSGFKVLRIPN